MGNVPESDATASESDAWGQLIQRGIFEGEPGGGTILNVRGIFEGLWWIPVVPALVIRVTVLLFLVFGDALQAAINPKEG